MGRGSAFHRKSLSSLYHSSVFSCFSCFLSLSTHNHAFTPPYVLLFPTRVHPPIPPLPPACCLPICMSVFWLRGRRPVRISRARAPVCAPVRVFVPANVSARICASRTEACVVKVCIRGNFLLFNPELGRRGGKKAAIL